ncbi:MAG: 6-pyruvoyl-tetrahydropterin synthase-related protein [Verrucomicrobiota bacterium]
MVDLPPQKTISYRENRSGLSDPVPVAGMIWRVLSLHYLVLLVVAVVETRVIWAPTLLSGHSAWHDLTRMVEFDAAVRAGNYFPAWSPDFYFGYGSPLFQFYSPLFYYLCEIPVLLGFDIPTAFKITQLLVLLGSGLTMYHLAAGHVSRWAACFGAVLYMIAPYRLVDLFVRHASAEHTAFLWLPLLTWGTERFVTQRSRSGLAAGILASAGLVLTHNVMALIGLPFCVAAGWWLGKRSLDWRVFLRAGCPAFFGIALTAFFWWPALSGRAFTHAEDSLTGGYYDYRQHFVGVGKFVDLSWGFGQSAAKHGEAMPLQVGLPNLICALGALSLLFTRGRTRWGVVGVAITVIALCLCLSISQPVWAALPLLKYVQFPWRFLGVAVFGTSICGAAVMDRLRAIYPRLELPIFLAGLITVMCAYFPYYSTARFMAAGRDQGMLIQATPDQVEAMAVTGALLPLGRIVMPATIRTADERGTSQDDFLPADVQEKPTAPASQFIRLSAGEVRHWERPAYNRYRATVVLPEAGRVELAQFWFPGWTASVDGKRTATRRSGAIATVCCNVPAGEHVVEFQYTALPQHRAGMMVSLLSLVSAATLLIRFQTIPQFRKEHAP